MKQFTFSALAFLLLFITIAANAQIAKTKTKPKDMENHKAMPMNKGNEMKNDNNMDKNDTAMNTTSANTNAPMGDYPYSPSYSGHVEMGDPHTVKMVLNLYKDYETNSFKMGDAFADTVTVMLSNGIVFQGKEKVLDAFKSHRGDFSSFAFEPQVWMPVKLTDRNENWVLVWDAATAIGKDGTKVTSFTHETWRINRDGKIDLMRQYEMQTTPPRQ